MLEILTDQKPKILGLHEPGCLLRAPAKAPWIRKEVSAGALAAAEASTLLARGSVKPAPLVAELDQAQSQGCGTCVKSYLLNQVQ
ncbi:MAG: hypothetical protein WHS46_14135 [Desulfosoma sp.]